MPGRFIACSVALMLGIAGAVDAQPLGTYRWQLQPYCNVLIVNVVQAGSVFTLDGLDDQCGATTAAAVVGTAFPNPDGSIGLGVSIVTTPGGTPVHVDATVYLPSVSGTWRDSTGTTGAFVLTPGPAVPGSPRPAARAAFPGGLSLGGAAISNVGAPVAATDAANRGYVDSLVATRPTTADVRAALIGEKVWKGLVSSTGVKGTTGPYTTSRVGTGNYSFQFDITGLGIPSGVGFPLVVATPYGFTAVAATVFVRGITIDAGVLTRISTQVLTFDAAGAAIDSSVGVFMTLPDADTGSPVPPLLRLTGDPNVSCSTTGTVTECTYREPGPSGGPRP
jgi:hypothetical protein